jgi:hydrogenase maturation protease
MLCAAEMISRTDGPAPGRPRAESHGSHACRPSVRVVCFGNRWQGDDGFGFHVFRYAHGRRMPPSVASISDGGVAGLNALPLLEGCDKAVIVDALSIGARVGSVHELLSSELDLQDERLSLHGMGVSEMLATLPLVLGAEASPEVVVIGAQVGPIRPFTEELSAPLRAAVPRAFDLVCRECAIPALRGRP